MRHLDHAKGVPCSICDAERRASNEELNELYAVMDRIGLKPIDIVRQKRIGGERIRFLSELSSAKVQELTEECRAYERRHPKRGGA